MKINKIKSKFFILAFLCSFWAYLVFPSYAETGSGDGFIIILQAGLLNINAYGDYNNPSFTGFQTAVSRNYKNFYNTTFDYIRVNDETDVTGHEVFISMEDYTWAYGGSSPGKGDLTNASSTPGDDQIRFYMYGPGGLVEWNDSSRSCPGSESNLTIYTQTVVYPGERLIFRSSEACPGGAEYSHDRFSITGPLNGFGSGNYTQTAIYTLTDGYTIK